MQEIAKNTTWGNSAEGGKCGKFEIKIGIIVFILESIQFHLFSWNLGINYGTVISGVIGFHKP